MIAVFETNLSQQSILWLWRAVGERLVDCDLDRMLDIDCARSLCDHLSEDTPRIQSLGAKCSYALSRCQTL